MKKTSVKILSILLAALIICTPLAIKLPNIVKADADDGYITEPFSEKRHYFNSLFTNFCVNEPGSVSNDSVMIKADPNGKSFGATRKIELENGLYAISFDVKSSGGQSSVKLGANVNGQNTGERFLNAANYTEWTTVQVMADVTDGYVWVGVMWYTGPAGTWIKLDNITVEKVTELDINAINAGKTTAKTYVSPKSLIVVPGNFLLTGRYVLEPLTTYTMYIPVSNTGFNGTFNVFTYNNDQPTFSENNGEKVANPGVSIADSTGNWIVKKLTFTTGLSGVIWVKSWLSNPSATLYINGLSIAKEGSSIQGYVDNNKIDSTANVNAAVEAGGFIGSNELKLTGTGSEYTVSSTHKSVKNGMYIVSGYFKSSGGSATTKLFANDVNTVIENGTENAPIDKWTYFSTAVNVTNGTLNVGLSYNSDQNGWLSVDGFKVEYAEAVTLGAGNTIPELTLDAGKEYIVFVRYKADGVSEGELKAEAEKNDSISLDVSSNDFAVAQIKVKAPASGKIKLTATNIGGTLQIDSVGYRKLQSAQPTIVITPATDIKEGLQIAANKCGIYALEVTPLLNPPKKEKYEKIKTYNNFSMGFTGSDSSNKDRVTYEKGGKITDSRIVYTTDTASTITFYDLMNGTIENGTYTVSAYIRSTGGQAAVRFTTNTTPQQYTEVKGRNYNAEYTDWILIQQQDIVVDRNYLYFALTVSQDVGQKIEIDGFQVKKVGETDSQTPTVTYKETIDVPVDNFTKELPKCVYNEDDGKSRKLVITNSNSGAFGTWYAGGVNNLENGTYTLTAYVKNTGGQSSAKLIANNGTELARQLFHKINGWVKVEITNIKVSDNKLAIGVWYDSNNLDHKFELKNVQLHLVGEPKAEEKLPTEEYAEIITVNNATLRPTATSVYDYLTLNAGGAVTDSRMTITRDSDFSATLYRSLANLENGTYTVTAKIRSSGGHNHAYLKASSGNCIVTSNNLSGAYSDWKMVELRGVEVKNGKLYVSLSVNSVAGKTFEIDGIQIKRLGKGPAVTEKQYEWKKTLYPEMFTRDTKNVRGGTGRWAGETTILIDGNLPNGSWYFGAKGDLEDGTYTLRGYARSTGGQLAAKIIANNGKEENIQMQYNIPDWVLVELSDIKVTNGKLDIGFWYGGADAGQKLEMCGIELLREGTGDIGIDSEKYEYFYRINNSTWNLTYNKDYDNYNYYHLSAYGDDGNKLVIKGEPDRSVTFYKSFVEGTLEDGQYTVAAKVRSSGGQSNASIRINAGPEVKTQEVLDLSQPIKEWKEVYIKNITVKNGYLFFGIFYASTSAEQWLEVTDFEIRKVSTNGKQGGEIKFPYAAEFVVPKGKLIKQGAITLTSGGYNSATKLVVGVADKSVGGGTSFNMTDLPNGYYTISAMVKSSGGLSSGHIFVNTTSIAEKGINTQFKYSIDTWSRIETRDIYVSEGKILVGIWAGVEPGEWAYIDDIKLEYQGDMKIMDYKGGEGPKYDAPVEEVIELIKPSENRPKSPELDTLTVEKKGNIVSSPITWIAIAGGVLVVAGLTVLVIIFLNKKKKGKNAL